MQKKRENFQKHIVFYTSESVTGGMYEILTVKKKKTKKAFFIKSVLVGWSVLSLYIPRRKALPLYENGCALRFVFTSST